MLNQPSSPTLLLLAADAILVAHLVFVGFVVLGLAAIVTGKLRHWAWVCNPWFRWLHLAAIGIVVAQAWMGMICPLTQWEMALRQQAGEPGYAGTFISHWLGTLLYYDFPEWVFAVGYSLFGILVVTSWLWARPRPCSRQAPRHNQT